MKEKNLNSKVKKNPKSRTVKNSPKLGQSQSVADLSMSSIHTMNNGRTVLLPPLNSGMLSIETKKISRYNNVPNPRFHEPSSVTKIKASVPVSYLENFSSFTKSLNKSNSNLSKDLRFKKRTIFEQDLEDLPCPLSYNLSNLNSIAQKAQATKEDTFRNEINTKKDFDRFKDKTYFKELDRGTGGPSPGPCAYDSIKATTIFPRVRKS